MPHPQRWPRPSAAEVARTIGLVLLLAVALLVVRPLAGPMHGATTNAVGITAGAGETVSFALTMFDNTGSRTAVVTEVSFGWEYDDVLPVRSVWLIDTSENVSNPPPQGIWRGLPEIDPALLHPVDDYRVEPGERVTVVFVLELDRDGCYPVPGITLHYTAGLARYTATDALSYTVYPPPGREVGC